ncbi:MAG: hypothetical protein WA081_03400 [Desulfosalsimonadaceae bacterium]
MFKKIIYILTILFVSITLSGCYPYLETLYDVVLLEENKNWTQDYRNSFVFLCEDCALNIDFWIVYDSGDPIFLKEVKKNPLLLKIDIQNKLYSIPLNEGSFSLSDTSITLTKNSKPINLADFRRDIYEDKYRKYNQIFFEYEYGLSEFDPDNNVYSLKVNDKFEIADSKNGLKCNCSIPSFDFKIIRYKELWVWIPGHAGPLF